MLFCLNELCSWLSKPFKSSSCAERSRYLFWSCCSSRTRIPKKKSIRIYNIDRKVLFVNLPLLSDFASSTGHRTSNPSNPSNQCIFSLAICWLSNVGYPLPIPLEILSASFSVPLGSLKPSDPSHNKNWKKRSGSLSNNRGCCATTTDRCISWKVFNTSWVPERKSQLAMVRQCQRNQLPKSTISNWRRIHDSIYIERHHGWNQLVISVIL